MTASFDLNLIEGELEESQHRLSTIFATVQVGIFIIDAETHTIVDANPKAAAIIGFPGSRSSDRSATGSSATQRNGNAR